MADVPSICFAEELIKAYPDAKVVLNERDVDKWLESMNATCGVVFGWRSWGWVAPWDKVRKRGDILLRAQHMYSDPRNCGTLTSSAYTFRRSRNHGWTSPAS